MPLAWFQTMPALQVVSDEPPLDPPVLAAKAGTPTIMAPAAAAVIAENPQSST